MTKEGLNNYRWVDVGRGIAILMVIICHSIHVGKLSYIASFGRHGVQLFFILSSFTLFNSYEKRHKKDSTNKVLFFYIRRFFRISPLYYIAALMYLIVEGTNITNIISFFASILFLNQFYIPAFNNIPPGGWSIGTEMLFYLFVPILFKSINTIHKSILFIIITIAFSIVINFMLINSGMVNQLGISNILEFLFFNQLPVFAFGIYFYQIKKDKNTCKNIFTYTKLTFFAACIFIIAIAFANFFILSLLYPILFSILFITFLIIYSQKNFDGWAGYVISEIGKVSFSMYLVHFIVIKILNHLFHTDYVQNFWAALYTLPIIIGITFLISKQTARIENWGIFLGQKIINRISSNMFLNT